MYLCYGLFLILLSIHSIIGLYLSFILVVGRFLRMSSTGLIQKIQFIHLPNVDKIMKLCLDFYLVREAGEFELEEELFAKLIFLYRSTETMVKVTRNDNKEKIE